MITGTLLWLPDALWWAVAEQPLLAGTLLLVIAAFDSRIPRQEGAPPTHSPSRIKTRPRSSLDSRQA